jgi:hypothetical protein
VRSNESAMIDLSPEYRDAMLRGMILRIQDAYYCRAPLPKICLLRLSLFRGAPTLFCQTRDKA